MSARSLDTAWLATLPSRHLPRWTRAWWPAATFGGFLVVVFSEPADPCTLATPCAPDPVGDAGLGLAVAGAVLTAVHGPTALAATVVGLLVSAGTGNPWWAWAAAAAHVGFQAAVVARRRRRPEPGPTGPLTAPPTAEVAPLPRATRGLLGAAGLLVAMLALAGVLSWHEGAAQDVAPVRDGRVVAQDADEFTVDVALDAGGRRTVDVYDPADYPVGTDVRLWAFDDGSARLLSEPYDPFGAWAGAGFGAAAALVTAASLLHRHRRRHAFLVRPQPRWHANARLLPGVAFVHPLDAGPDDEPVLALAVPHAWTEDEDLETDGEVWDLPDPVLVELAGLPLPGHWCALQVDGAWLPVLDTAVDGAGGPPLVLQDAEVEVDEDGLPLLEVPVEDLSQQDVVPLDGVVAAGGRHATPLWVGLLSAVPALVVAAVGLDWVDGVAGWLAGWWPGTPFGPTVLRTLTAAALGLLALELVWWFRLRPRLRWDEDGLDVVPPVGRATRYGWDSLVEADLVPRGGLQLTLVTDFAPGLAEGPGHGEFPACEVEVPVAASGLPAVLRRGWRTGPELRAALLQARGTARHDRRAPVRIDGPVRPVLPWVLWVAVVAASAAGGWA
ncbi:hypothetical protein AB1207_10980 [Kineococcus endophyticus]|uniref:Membrane protein DUF2207 n=1 Tax=Kineococcus endophyticus TaxID=1181883 RepID=A0ABV3P6M0_9ACTN